MKKIISLLAFLLSPFWQYYKYLNLAKVLSIRKITNEGVYLYEQPEDKSRLYVIKLEGLYDKFSNMDFMSLRNRLRHDRASQLNYFFVSQGDYQIGYISTFSKDIANEVVDTMGLSICDTTDTIKFLLDIYSINKYTVDKNNYTLTPSIKIENLDKASLFDPLYHNLSTILKDGAYFQNEEYGMHQVIKYTNKKSFSYKDLYRKDFNGVFAMFIDLSDRGLTFQTDDYLSYAKRADRKIAPEIQKLQEEHKMSNLDSVVVNSIIISNSKKEALHTAGALGMEIAEKGGLDKLSILKRSFLLTREMSYDCIVPVENMNNLIGVRSRKNLTYADVKALADSKPWIDVKIDFYGKNIYEEFVNFCFRANDNPHSVLIADSGTGKSVAVQKILSSILRIDYEKETIGRWNEVKTRYFEIGGSSSELQKMIKTLYKDDVGLIEGTLSNMKFSIVDVKTKKILDETIVDEDSLSLSIKLLNVILFENNEVPLTASEQAVYERTLKSVYKNNLYKHKTISELRKMSSEAYSVYLNLFDEKGYSGTTRLSEIEDCGDISNLLKPTLNDIMGLLKTHSASSDLSKVQRDTYEDLSLKLEAVRSLESGLYGSLSNLILGDKPFFSFEFHKIKKNQSLLRAVFSFLFISIYEQDVEKAIEAKENGQKMKQTVYIFEESKNFFQGNEAISKLLISSVLEGRKFQIQALFVAQFVSHLPPEIVKGVSTFFFLMPKLKDKRASLKGDIMKLFPTPEVDYLVDNIAFRTLGIISGQGAYSCKLDLTQKELKLFSV